LGPYGEKGDKGRDGFPGITGSKGESGPAGFPGIKGTKGDCGLPGLPGFKGNDGTKGKIDFISNLVFLYYIQNFLKVIKDYRE
jgi:hypothetical protein